MMRQIITIKKITSIILCVLLLVTISSVDGTFEEIDDISKENSLLDVSDLTWNSNGNIAYVGGNGPNNYTQIQDAIDAADDGDTVFVFDDSSPYFENIFINKTICLIGENRNTTIIDGGEKGDVLEVNIDWSTIREFTIRRDGWYSDGIVLHANNTFIFGNIIINCGCGIFSFQSNKNVIVDNYFSHNHDGIKITYSNENSIKNNTFEANYLSGIALFDSRNNIVSSNNIIANTDIAIQGSFNGIRVVDSDNNTFSNNSIVSILDNCYEGISLWDSKNNNIEGNLFVKNSLAGALSEINNVKDNIVNGKPLVYLVGESDEIIDTAGQVVLLECENITVQNLEITHTKVGIFLGNTLNCFISNNSISNSWLGLSLESSRNNKLSDNLIQTTGFGVYLIKSPFNEISDNIIQDNRYGRITINSDLTMIKGNNIKDNLRGIIINGGQKNTILSNMIENNSEGLFLVRAFNNNIERNNFLGNRQQDAYFTNSFFNSWNRNYWNETGRFHRINGEIYINRGDFMGAPPPIIILIFSFDWFSAREPYDIS